MPVGDVAEGVVSHSIVDAQLAQLACQPVMAVEVDLQPARQPRRHTHMAQPQILVHEVEVVMQALAVIRYQIRLAGLLVVPRLVGRAGLHGRENADQPRLLTPAGQNLFHPVFLPEVPLADELDLDSRFGRHLLRVLANPVAERLGELRIVEYPIFLSYRNDVIPGKADLRQRAENQHPVPTAQHSGDLGGVTLRQQFNAHSGIITRPVWFRLRRVRYPNKHAEYPGGIFSVKRQFWAAVIAATTFAGVANAQLSWTAGASSTGYEQAIAYGGGVFVAVGPAPQFAVSSDGLNWTPTATNPSIWWTGVTYGNGTFVAVGTNGFATSSDGTNWNFTTPPNNTEWNGVAYGNGIFVTVAFDGISHSVATSTDGVAWTVQTAAAANQWVSITYGSGLFVAVAQSGSGNRVMTSPDGVTWTSRTSAANLNWASVTYGNGLFVAVAQDGVTNSVMTSPDGITWTLRTAAASAQWYSVAYGAGLFAAVAQDGITNSVMTSSDGVTWTIGPAATADQWQCIAFGNGIFVAGSTSGDTMAAAPPTSATTYTFTGPSGGTLNSGSNNFAVTPNGQYTGTITVTPSGGGLSTATVLTFNASSAAQMFTITPTAVGPVTLTPSNNGSLTDASVLMYSTPPGAPTLTSVTAGSHQISVAFIAPGSTGGSAIIGFTATCGSSAVSGSASPIIVTSLTNGAAYTCTVTASNTNGTSAASSASSSVTPTAPATGYSLTGPSGGSLNTASTNFTVTPNGLYTGTITITPSGGTLSTPVVLTFSNSATRRRLPLHQRAWGR